MQVTVRAATAADAGAISDIYAQVVRDSVATFEETAPDVDEIRRRMLTEPRLPWLVAEVTDADVTDPDVTDPDVTDPDVTDPDVTDPDVTDPDVTDPEVADAEVRDGLGAGGVAGYAYAAPHRQRAAYRWSADCSVHLDPRYRSQGVGRALYARLVPEVRELGYVSLYAGIALPNPASVGLHESMGFRSVGVFHRVGFKHGAWRDVGWWHLQLTEPPSSPAEPLRWHPFT